MADLADVFTAHLAENAQRFFPDLSGASAHVELTDVNRRVDTDLYHYNVGNYSVLVKARHADYRPPAVLEERPRLFQIKHQQKHNLEFQALSAIYNHFDMYSDPRFGAIRVLDYLPEHQAIMMVKVTAPNFRDLFARYNRLQSRFQDDDILEIFRNIGAWLKVYHSLPMQEFVHIKYETRDSFIDITREITAYLGEKLGNQSYFDRVMQILNDRAASSLPEQLPMGRGHGDFAPRNILIENDGRVTVIDTLATWQIPIYHDITYFVIRLYTSQPQVYTFGLAYSQKWLKTCENAFLEGYFGSRDNIPHDALNVFNIQSLLDKWTALIGHASSEGNLLKRIRNKVRISLTNRLFYDYLNDLIKE